jgi:hypothetical protein
MTNGCRIVLLYLAEHMNAKGIVSTPRSTLAEGLGVAPARITEAIQLGRQLGFLDIVRRARPGVTATYQALIPSPVEVRHPYLADMELEVRPPGHHKVRHPYLETGSRGTNNPTPSSGSATQGSSAPAADLPSSQARAALKMTRPSRCVHGVPNGTVPDPWKDGRPVCDECDQTQSEPEAS